MLFGVVSNMEKPLKTIIKVPLANFAGSHVVRVDPDLISEISYMRPIVRLVVGGGFEPP
jgi:hypothetical protein